MQDLASLSREIKAEALRLGFDLAGISEATFLEKEARDLENWLNQQRHGSMQYMENHFEKRTDPRLLVEGAKSVISVIHNYFPAPADEAAFAHAPIRVSRYAWGEDYHTVLKQKLYLLYTFIQNKVGSENVNGRVFTDSAPVMDKAWAKRSGLGWIGKHTNLIVPQRGSYFFIGEIILDLPLQYDGPIRDYCGTCTRCIDACPTDALQPYQIDANRCISYLTIELKEAMDQTFEHQLNGWAYGCDICQEVCPWNRFSQAHTGGDFRPILFPTTDGPKGFPQLSAADWEELTEQTFKKLARKSAMSRIKWAKMKDNIERNFKNKNL